MLYAVYVFACIKHMLARLQHHLVVRSSYQSRAHTTPPPPRQTAINPTAAESYHVPLHV